MNTITLDPITDVKRIVEIPAGETTTIIEIVDNNSTIKDSITSNISVGEGATLRYIYLLDESVESNVIENREIEVAKDAKVESFYCFLGGKENSLNLTQKVHENASLTHSVLFLTNDSQKFDIIETDELVDSKAKVTVDIKGLLSQSSFTNYKGTIRVDKDAQKTIGNLKMQSYILGKKAQSNMIPSLEILADDVKASHSASVAHINEEQLFYMQSRGLSEKQSIQLFIEGFIHDFVNNLDNDELKEKILKQAEKKYCI